jgi:hypothetical protein
LSRATSSSRCGARACVSDAPAMCRDCDPPAYGRLGDSAMDPRAWFPPSHPSDLCAAPRAAMRTGRGPNRATRHRAPRARGHARMHARTVGRAASLGPHAPRQVGPVRSRRSRHARKPCLSSVLSAAGTSAAHAPPAPVQRHSGRSYSFLRLSCTSRPRRSRTSSPPSPDRRVPADGCPAHRRGTRQRGLRSGQHHQAVQVSSRDPPDHSPGRGRPHIAGRRPPLRRQGHIARIEKDPGSFQQTRDLWVNLKFRIRVSV